MTWPFENDTGAIVKKLAERSLTSEKRRNLMVVVAVALAAFLICLSAVISVSVAQIQRNQVADTYEAVFDGMDESGVAALKELPEFARVGEYYLLGQEHSGQGYNASYVYAAPSCKNGEINMDEFASYVSEYQRFAALNEYDLQCMMPLFYYQIAVCDYYGQYYASTAANRHIYLHQAIFSTKLLRWLEEDSAVVKPLDSS